MEPTPAAFSDPNFRAALLGTAPEYSLETINGWRQRRDQPVLPAGILPDETLFIADKHGETLGSLSLILPTSGTSAWIDFVHTAPLCGLRFLPALAYGMRFLNVFACDAGRPHLWAHVPEAMAAAARRGGFVPAATASTLHAHHSILSSSGGPAR